MDALKIQEDPLAVDEPLVLAPSSPGHRLFDPGPPGSGRLFSPHHKEQTMTPGRSHFSSLTSPTSNLSKSLSSPHKAFGPPTHSFLSDATNLQVASSTLPPAPAWEGGASGKFRGDMRSLGKDVGEHPSGDGTVGLHMSDPLVSLRSELAGLRGLFAECRTNCEDAISQLARRVEEVWELDKARHASLGERLREVERAMPSPQALAVSRTPRQESAEAAAMAARVQRLEDGFSRVKCLEDATVALRAPQTGHLEEAAREMASRLQQAEEALNALGGRLLRMEESGQGAYPMLAARVQRLEDRPASPVLEDMVASRFQTLEQAVSQVAELHDVEGATQRQVAGMLSGRLQLLNQLLAQPSSGEGVAAADAVAAAAAAELSARGLPEDTRQLQQSLRSIEARLQRLEGRTQSPRGAGAVSCWPRLQTHPQQPLQQQPQTHLQQQHLAGPQPYEQAEVQAGVEQLARRVQQLADSVMHHGSSSPGLEVACLSERVATLEERPLQEVVIVKRLERLGSLQETGQLFLAERLKRLEEHLGFPPLLQPPSPRVSVPQIQVTTPDGAVTTACSGSGRAPGASGDVGNDTRQRDQLVMEICTRINALEELCRRTQWEPLPPSSEVSVEGNLRCLEQLRAHLLSMDAEIAMWKSRTCTWMTEMAKLQGIQNGWSVQGAVACGSGRTPLQGSAACGRAFSPTQGGAACERPFSPSQQGSAACGRALSPFQGSGRAPLQGSAACGRALSPLQGSAAGSARALPPGADAGSLTFAADAADFRFALSGASTPPSGFASPRSPLAALRSPTGSGRVSPGRAGHAGQPFTFEERV